MSNTGFQFDSSQQYQLDAIDAVVDLFKGQPKDAGSLRIMLRGSVTTEEFAQGELMVDMPQEEVGAIGNKLVLDNTTLLDNLQEVQDHNGLEVRESLANNGLDFDIEMETGTGKTYVYMRTIFELRKHYGFSKFIILVPSVAIREGVNTSIRLMREHFSDLYPEYPFDASVYSGDRAEEVQAFATASSVQILMMTIDAVRGDKNTRIIHQHRDKLNGLRPIDYLKATHPIIIMDEPQNMESLLSQSAVSELAPAFTLRYSATHKRQRNLTYRLDPVDAHNLELVKQIVVAEVTQRGADATPYIKLQEVRHAKAWVAKLELVCRKADGSLERMSKSVKPHHDLSNVSDNPVYEGWRINEMRIADSVEPASIELTNHGVLAVGETIGGATGAIYKEMIHETVREHLRKEAMLCTKDIKVLSLFFVDKVASYLGEGVNNNDADGEFVRWFDEAFIEERSKIKNKHYLTLLPQEPRELRRAYFSQLKVKGKTTFVDSSGTTAKDDDAYELIMRDKQRLLDANEPVRFIFSHSALREGWDNPNVFQICTLREIGAEIERRQTLGRGMRLPVAKTGKGYERVKDRGIATLTVIANESYQIFAQRLQDEYKAAGVAIGQVRPNEFAKLPKQDADGALTDKICGSQWSQEVFKYLESHDFINKGSATSKFQPEMEGFSLDLPDEFKPYEAGIIALVRDASIEKYVKPRAKRQTRKFNKALYATPEFEAFWNAISQKTIYRVEFDSSEFIKNAITAIKQAPEIQPLRIEVTRAGVKVLRGGTRGQELGTPRPAALLKGNYDLPDIISELQQSTMLTRTTLAKIVAGSDRLIEFINNPNDFIAVVQRSVQSELEKIVVKGIQYEKIGGSIYELRELQADGEEEKESFLDRMYEVNNQDKTDFDYVVYESSVEYDFAKLLDDREDVKLFMKLPGKFKIPTPVGDYNPDWAIIKQVNGEEKIYMIRETKGTQDDNKLRPSELAKIKSAEKHFAAIKVNYDRSTPEKPNL